MLLTGASGGIGKAIARALHGRGAELLLSGRRADVLERLAADLGERAETLPADLADAEQVVGLVARAGRVDVLVANAALPGSGRIETYSAEQVDRALDVNLRAPIQLVRELLPQMLDRRSGHLVFISSMSGKIATAGGALYAATKFGLRGFAFSLREDLRDTGVGVTTVFPGLIADAGMWADSGVESPHARTRRPDEVADAVIRGIETGRAEIDVASLDARLGGLVAGAAPSLVAAFVRRMGGTEVAERLADAQRDRR